MTRVHGNTNSRSRANINSLSLGIRNPRAASRTADARCPMDSHRAAREVTQAAAGGPVADRVGSMRSDARTRRVMA